MIEVSTPNTVGEHRHVYSEWMDQRARQGKEPPTEYRICQMRVNGRRCPHYETRIKPE